MENAEFNRIAEQYIDMVYCTALSYCKCKTDAEDVVQNTFYKLLKSDVLFENDKHIRRWLIKVAINECKSLWRSFWHKNVISFDDLDCEPEFIELRQKEVFNEVMKLPHKYRTVLYLYYYEGYSCDEVAEILGITPTNVQTRLMRARDKLKEQLKEAEL